MADRVNIADKETLDLTLNQLTLVLSNLQDILSRLGARDDTSIDTLFGLTKVTASFAGASIVKRVLRGTTSTVNDTAKEVTHESVNVDKSIVIFNASPSSSNSNHGVRLLNRTSTTLNFTSVNSSYITWQILEFN